MAGSVISQDAYNTVFGVAALSTAAGVVMAFFLRGKKRNRQLQSERAVEYAAAEAL